VKHVKSQTGLLGFQAKIQGDLCHTTVQKVYRFTLNIPYFMVHQRHSSGSSDVSIKLTVRTNVVSIETKKEVPSFLKLAAISG